MILITGATGLVGAHLLAKLLQSQNIGIKALYRNPSGMETTRKILGYYFGADTGSYFQKITWVQADILDIPSLSKAFEGVEYVYHCAGMISNDPGDYHQLRKTNIEGTAHVANLCLENNVKKLCHVSSIAALEEKPNGEPVSENSQWEYTRKHSVYAITKYGGEMEVWRASQEGLEVIIVNPGIIIGAGNWNSGSGLLFKKTDKGNTYYFPKVTGFVPVEDLVKAMILLVNSPINNERFVLVAENLSFKKVLYEVAESLQKEPPGKPLQPWHVFLGWLYQSLAGKLFGAKRQITRQAVRSLFEETRYDASKIKQETGFEFSSVQEAIKKTGRHYLKEKNSL